MTPYTINWIQYCNHSHMFCLSVIKYINIVMKYTWDDFTVKMRTQKVHEYKQDIHVVSKQ